MVSNGFFGSEAEKKQQSRRDNDRIERLKQVRALDKVRNTPLSTK